MARNVQLQINQSGAWRSGLDFDAQGLMDAQGSEAFEVLHHLDQFLRLAYGPKTTARIVETAVSNQGKVVSTRNVLIRWTREKGWRPA